MTAPNSFITYVSDATSAAAFYADLFEIQPTLTTPRFVAFRVAPEVEFAVWSGVSDAAVRATPRTSEVCVSVRGGDAEVDSMFARWSAKGVAVVSEPHDEPFGRTFVISDPDGNLVRVAPVDA
jgi:predicted enzyme related to lactoylglutathione lyase